MIKVCKEKAVRRWSEIGLAFWYIWNISFFISITHLILIVCGVMELSNWFMLSLTNAVFSGMFMMHMAENNIISKLKEKQKLFGWDESC